MKLLPLSSVCVKKGKLARMFTNDDSNLYYCKKNAMVVTYFTVSVVKEDGRGVREEGGGVRGAGEGKRGLINIVTNKVGRIRRGQLSKYVRLNRGFTHNLLF